MIAGGWKKKNGYYMKYYSLQEVSIVCNKEELENIILFLTDILEKIKESGVHDQHWHYMYWSEHNIGKPIKLKSDFVLITSEQDNPDKPDDQQRN